MVESHACNSQTQRRKPQANCRIQHTQHSTGPIRETRAQELLLQRRKPIAPGYTSFLPYSSLQDGIRLYADQDMMDETIALMLPLYTRPNVASAATWLEPQFLAPDVKTQLYSQQQMCTSRCLQRSMHFGGERACTGNEWLSTEPMRGFGSIQCDQGMDFLLLVAYY